MTSRHTLKQDPNAGKYVMDIRKSDLLGSWSLVSWVQTRGDEEHLPIGDQPAGKILFTDFDLVAVSIADSTRPVLQTGDFSTADIEERAAAFAGYLGYVARYALRDNNVHIEILNCSYPNWIGQEQMRMATLTGDRLVLEAPPRDVNGVAISAKLSWRRDVPEQQDR